MLSTRSDVLKKTNARQKRSAMNKFTASNTFLIFEEITHVNILSTKRGFDNEVSPVRKQARWTISSEQIHCPVTFLIVEDNTPVNMLSTRSGFEKNVSEKKREGHFFLNS